MNFTQVRRIVEHPHLKDQTDFAVLMVLAYHADETGRAWPSKPTIAREARISDRCADDVIARLGRANYFTVERGGGKAKANVYLLHVEQGREVEKRGSGSKPRSICGATDAGYQVDGDGQTPQDLRGIGAIPRSANGVTERIPRRGYGETGAPYKEKYFNNDSEGGGAAHARTREAPPPQASPNASLLYPSPDDEMSQALIAICGVNAETPSPRDRENWPIALEVARRLSATPAQLRDFREEWFATPTAGGQRKRTLYLSNVASHLPQFLQSKPEVRNGNDNTNRADDLRRRAYAK